MSHLPELTNKKGGGKIEHEINIYESAEVVEKDRIMIVDDEPYNIDSIKVIVQCATFDIPNLKFKSRLDTACNGYDALQLVQ